jgi:hypothetical protein
MKCYNIKSETGYKWTLVLIIFSLCLNQVKASTPSNQVPKKSSRSFPIVDTGVNTFYNNRSSIQKPQKGDSFYGQDAHFVFHQPKYKDNGDGTVTDLVTGLMWQKSPLEQKLTFNQAILHANSFNLAGYTDWRLPTIKELYSLIMFYGKDPSGEKGSETNHLQPFISTKYFDFRYGNPAKGERIIDAQYVSFTKYVSTTMGGNATVFGVNFADGRIKGYPISSPRGEKTFEVLYVRGNPDYGTNSFKDNNNGTVSDLATGLMWSKNDSGEPMNWEEALQWVQQKNTENYLGYNNWRLPDAKELQSIVDYSRSPSTSNSAAINPLFNCTSISDELGNKDYPYYWTSTTHANSKGFATQAVCICFGNALGWIKQRHSNSRQLIDVHGAGAQRSDPKAGNPEDYPYGHGPQGDVRRIYNFVRPVRNSK